MTSIIRFRHTKNSRNFSSESFLSNELYKAATTLSDQGFAQYQCSEMSKFHSQFLPDSLSVSVQTYDQNGQFLETIWRQTYNHPQGCQKKYLENSHLDEMASMNFARPGAAIFNTHLRTLDEWRQNEFYQNFNLEVGFHHSIIITYLFPFKNNYRIRFNYQTVYPRAFSVNVTKDEVEYYTLPFFVCCLYILNIIDESILKKWISLLSGITPSNLSVLRELCNSRRFNKNTIANKLNVSPKVINNQFQDIYSKTLHKLTDDGEIIGNNSQIADILNAFTFLRFVGQVEPESTLSNAFRNAH